MGHECSFPLRTCLSFSENEGPKHGSSISKEAALAFLDESEELGLVHTVSNCPRKGIGYSATAAGAAAGC